jgi:hypothetical protein
VKIRGWIVVDWWSISSTPRGMNCFIPRPSASLKNRVLLLSKDGNQNEPREGERRRNAREREREQTTESLEEDFFFIATQGISPNSLSQVSLLVDLNPYPKSPFMFSFFFSFVLTDC